MIERAEQYVADGFTTVKMQVAHIFSADEDVINVRDMRSALGDDIGIMVDVNKGWNVDQAITIGRRLDNYDLVWLEEPVIADDFDCYHKIAKAIRTPVVGGENHFTHHDLKPFCPAGMCPFFNQILCAAAIRSYALLPIMLNERV